LVTFVSVVAILNFLVNLLLLLAAGRLCGFNGKRSRIFLAAGLGGLYAWGCLQPGMGFLGNSIWRIVSLGLMSLIAFGISRNTVRKGLVFSVLSLAVGGAVQIMGEGGFWGILMTAVVLWFLSFAGFRNGANGTVLIPVELYYKEKQLHLTALQDTGNTLRDPVTGQHVLVIGSEAAQQLTGLTKAQLMRPVESIGLIPGLRLIPYHSVGINSGFLLALRLQNVKIGKWRGSSLVAFAPDGLGLDEEFQALAGGVL